MQKRFSQLNDKYRNNSQSRERGGRKAEFSLKPLRPKGVRTKKTPPDSESDGGSLMRLYALAVILSIVAKKSANTSSRQISLSIS